MEPTYRIAQALHERRAEVGLYSYGEHLKPFNKRCSLIDAIEESADMLCYLLNMAQESRHLLIDLMANSVRLREAGHAAAADGLDKIIVGMGGKETLAKYNEILAGGTVAENATVATALRDEANPQVREYRFDRYVNGKLKAEGAALVAANDREAAEKLTKLCCDHPVIMIGFAVQPTPDPRDEALRVAEKALALVCYNDDRVTGFDHLIHRMDMEACKTALDAIRAAGGAR